ncbi:hypothetical protein [Ligilactobacillus agilis]|uniref:hypothetical protein n=2 Tax=Ligilactobacillus agilis TaxID=1601 RepID=UPI0022E47FA2|nr:hypothetical protein [Ligilactobacillus agilis]
MNDETIAKYRMKLSIQLDIPENQLNAREFIRLIKKHKLQVTKAVETHLASACRYRNLINGLNKESYIKNSNGFMAKKLVELDKLRVISISNALSVAFYEKELDCRLVEDADDFLKLTKVKHQGDLDKVNEYEQCILKLSQNYCESYRVMVTEDYIGGKLPKFK